MSTIVFSGKAASTLKKWACWGVMPQSSKTPFTEENHAATFAGQIGGGFTALLTYKGATARAAFTLFDESATRNAQNSGSPIRRY
jgi:hypothetical protein